MDSPNESEHESIAIIDFFKSRGLSKDSLYKIKDEKVSCINQYFDRNKNLCINKLCKIRLLYREIFSEYSLNLYTCSDLIVATKFHRNFTV